MSKKIGRRKFMKRTSSALLGLAAGPLMDAGSSYAGNSGAIEYRVLGKTGLKVTSVGMGVMNCSDSAVLLRAFDLGVNFFDTARKYAYGKNEELVGKAFRGKRDKVLIQTKVKLTSSEKQNREMVEASLRSLRTDYADVLLAHSLKKPEHVNNPATISFLKDMKKEGKARFTGFSSHTDMASLLRAAAKGGDHDVALVSYNFTHSNELKEAIASAVKSGIGVVAMKTQAGGYKAEDMAGLSPHQAALKYVIMDRNVATTVPGVTTIEELEECFAVMGTRLSRKDSHDLQQYESYLHGRVCTMCGGCKGECPHGIKHTDVLRIKMYHDGYKSDELVNQAIREAGVSGNLKQCGECSSCSITCRRGLDVRSQMEWVKRVMAKA